MLQLQLLGKDLALLGWQCPCELFIICGGAAHYDVQPVDPLSLWNQPPFDISLKDGHFHGRGVDDDKGGLLLPIQVRPFASSCQQHSSHAMALAALLLPQELGQLIQCATIICFLSQTTD